MAGSLVRLKRQLSSHGVIELALLPKVIKQSSLSIALQLHSLIVKAALSFDPAPLNSLISSYSKHSLIQHARNLFDTMPLRDSITFSSMINAYIASNYFPEAIDLFRDIQFSGFDSKPELVAAVVSVLGRLGNLHHGKEVHGISIRDGTFDTCVMLSTAVVDMYSRCGSLDCSWKVFDEMPDRNTVSWTTMISGCVMNGENDLGLKVFGDMVEEGIKLNRVTLVTALRACSELGVLKHGRGIHGYAFRHGFELEPRFMAALIDMYGKCNGGYVFARAVYWRAEARDVVTWSSMMYGSSRNVDYFGTMELFHLMLKDGIEPNYVTVLSLLEACIGLASVEHGRAVHGYLHRSGLLSEIFVGNSLIDMYAKCGCLESSTRAFSEMPVKDLVSYSSMISSYSLHGHGYEALRLFSKVQEEGMEADSMAFLAVLSACSNSGLVDEGRKIFAHLTKDNDKVQSLELYACFVDLLGKQGLLEEACDVIGNMPMTPSPNILSSLVSACRVHGKFEEAERVAIWLVDFEPRNAANYALLSSLYAEEGNWCGVEMVDRLMKERGLAKNPGRSTLWNKFAYSNTFHNK